MDSKDFEIIDCLKADASKTVREISKKTRIPITTVHHRIKALKKKGIIKKTTVELDYEKMGYSITAYILIVAQSALPSGEKVSQKKICEKISKIPGVETIDIITGDTDIFVKIRVKNVKELSRIILEKIRELPGVDRTKTITVLEQIKSS
jgi:Lrp/AsnC family transcriptional regulator, leucine-responsive regulatory protein